MALLEILMLAFTLGAAIFLSPEPLVVRLPANASQWMLGAGPVSFERLLYGLTVGGAGSEDVKALPSTLENAREKAQQAVEEIAHAADTVKEAMNRAQVAAMFGKDKHTGGPSAESLWKEAIPSMEDLKAKMQDISGSAWKEGTQTMDSLNDKVQDASVSAWKGGKQGVEHVQEVGEKAKGTAQETGRKARGMITGPTLAALEKAAEFVAQTKQRAQQVAGAAKDTAQAGAEAVGHTISDAVGKVSEGVKRTKQAAWEKVAGVGEAAWEIEEAARRNIEATGHAAWEKVAEVGEAVWEMEEAVRESAIRAGHAFWHKVCQAEEQALDTVCRVEGAAKRAGSTVFHRGQAVVHCIKKEAFHPNEIQALQGKVQWCEDAVEGAAHKLSSSTGDFFNVLKETAQSAPGTSEWTETGSKAGEALRSGADKVKDAGCEWAGSAQEGCESMQDGVQRGADNLHSAPAQAYDAGKSAVRNAGEKIEEKVEGAYEGVTGGATDAYDKAREKMEETGRQATEPVHAATRKAKEAYEEAKEAAMKTFGKGKAQARDFVESAKETVEDAKDKAAEGVEKVKETATGTVGAGESAFDQAKGKASELEEQAKDFAGRAAEAVPGRNDAADLLDKSKAGVSDIAGKASDAGQDAAQAAKDSFGANAGKACDWQPAVGESAEKYYDAAEDGLHTAKETAKGYLVKDTSGKDSWLQWAMHFLPWARHRQAGEGGASSASGPWALSETFLRVALQRLVYLGAFALAFGSTFSTLLVNSPGLVKALPVDYVSGARDALSATNAKTVALSTAVCLGVNIQQWWALHEASNKWQLYPLGAALLAAATNWLLVHPHLAKIRSKHDEVIGKEEPTLSSNNGEAVEAGLGEAFDLNTNGEDKAPAEPPVSPRPPSSPHQTIEGLEDQSPILSPPSRERQSMLGGGNQSVMQQHQQADMREKVSILKGASIVAEWTSLLGLTWHLWHLACHLAL